MLSTPAQEIHPDSQKHHPLTIALHWGSLACIVIAVSAILLCELVEDKYQILNQIHRQMGLLVLFGVALRLGVRLRHGMANHMDGMSWPIRWAAVACHLGLYALLIGLTILGWATTNAHNLPIRFMGLIPLPTLVDEDSELADQLTDYHVLGSWILLGLVAFHAAAALYHHLVRRDLVLWAMLPRNESATRASEAGAEPAESSLAVSGQEN